MHLPTRTIRQRPGPLALGLLTLLLAAVACTPTAPTTPAGPPPNPTQYSVPSTQYSPSPSEIEWDRTVAAAKREGRVVVAGSPGDTYRQLYTAFQQAYPEIQVEYSGLSGRDFVPRLAAERQAEQFLWDLFVLGAETGHSAAAIGAVEPIRAALIRPERTDDRNWVNGFDWGFMDAARERVFSSSIYINFSLWINRDVVRESELSHPEHLLDPRWKGRIVWNEPRETGAGSLQAARLMLTLGEERMRRVFAEQQIVVTRDRRQQIEWLVRGQYPIGVGIDPPQLEEFQRLGLGLSVLPLEREDASIATTGSAGCACLLTRAPHPNAARVYLDWFLSREGQTLWNQIITNNSRRLDVPPADPPTMPRHGVDYLIINREENQPIRDAVLKLAKDILP
jgi:iron(III) transport system substrate-binding protein